MPTYTKQTFLQESPEKQAEILQERAEERIEREEDSIRKTIEAQEGMMDKIYMSIFYSIKNDSQNFQSNIPPEERFDLEMNDSGSQEEENDLSREISDNALNAIVPEPTLEGLRAMYFYVAMVSAKSTHDLIKEQKKLQEKLSHQYDAETSRKLSEALTLNGGGLSGQIENHGNILLQDMSIKKCPNPISGGETTFEAVMEYLLKQDLKTKLVPLEHPNMTVAQFMDLLKMNAKEKQDFLKKMNCRAEDNLADAYWNELQKDDIAMAQYKAKSDADKPRAKTNMIFNSIASTYVKTMPKVWHQEGVQAYRNGLTRTEQKDLEAGYQLKDRIGEMAAVKRELKQQGIDYDKMEDQMVHDNAVINYQTCREKVTSGKRLFVKYESGFSEAIFADAEKNFIERRKFTDGAIEKLESIPNTWKYHSSNSTKYNKVVSALKAYNEAMARGEGGKAQEERNRLVKACLDYVKRKESKRNHQNAQDRFDIIMTVLYEELKPESFQRLMDKVNRKRSEADEISLEQFQNRKKKFIKASVKAERIDQNQSRENATQIHFSHMPALMELETRYAPPVNDPPLPNDAQTVYEPIAKRGMPATEKHKLSAHDYAALSFANALSSSKRGDPLTENNPLIPCDDAVEDGKKVTEIALKSYGEGDKVPLAKIVTLGIKKLSMEAEFKSPAQKACLQEMSQRLVNMLKRDPELKKYAEREGLKGQDLEAAKNIVQEKKLAGDAPERTESLISLS